MPAAPIGSSWASGSWPDTAWEAGTWARLRSGAPGAVLARVRPRGLGEPWMAPPVNRPPVAGLPVGVPPGEGVGVPSVQIGGQVVSALAQVTGWAQSQDQVVLSGQVTSTLAAVEGVVRVREDAVALWLLGLTDQVGRR